MKKKYMKPNMEVVLMRTEGQLLAGSGMVQSTGLGWNWNEYADNNEEGL